MQGKSLLSISFSNTFARNGNWLVGLYDEGKLSGLLDLEIKIIFENFSSSGKYSRQIALNKSIRNRITFQGQQAFSDLGSNQIDF